MVIRFRGYLDKGLGYQPTVQHDAERDPCAVQSSSRVCQNKPIACIPNPQGYVGLSKGGQHLHNFEGQTAAGNFCTSQMESHIAMDRSELRALKLHQEAVM